MDELKRVFLFDCSCRRCLSGDRECASEVDEYLCNSCIKGVFLPFKACDDDVSLEWKCEACNQLRS